MNTAIPVGAMPAFSSPTDLDFDASLVNGSRPTLKNAAVEMETIFLSMLLKQMRESSQSEEGEGMFPGDSGDVYGGLFDFYMSKHMAQAGGIGIGTSLLKQLEGKQSKESQLYAPIPAGAAARPSLPRTPAF
jgi:peptidoglycan hydrolase FlgJ